MILMAMTCAIMYGSIETRYEAGHQFAVRFSDSEITRNRPYFLFGGKFRFDGEKSETAIHASGRSFLDKRENELALGALNVSWNKGHFNFVLGVQEVAWGETFGVQVTDLINPRDLRDAFFNEPSWIRQGVLALNAGYIWDKLSIQTIVTPVPRNNRYPYEIATVPVVEAPDFEVKNFGQDTEAGARLGYLFDMGLDTNLFYLTHFNRNPTFVSSTSNGRAVLEPLRERVHSVGAIISYALKEWVFRVESVVHLKSPYQSSALSALSRVRFWRSIFGTDWTPDNSLDIGLQYHLDDAVGDQRHWVAARVEKKFFDELLSPSVFVFYGLNNSDFWIEPRLSWHIATDWSLTVLADIVINRSAMVGYFDLFQNEDRVFTWLKYRF